MGIAFRNVEAGRVKNVTGHVPAGYVVGLVGEAGSGAEVLLGLAGGRLTPDAGTVERAEGGDVRVLDQPFALDDALAREKGIAELAQARRGGTAILLYSHDEALVERICDEVWWVADGRIAHRGTPRETLDAYRRHVAARLRDVLPAGELLPRFRQGDGRAELLSIETLGADGALSSVWAAGEQVAIRVSVRFHGAVEDPVVGILIRTRIGLNVFGTNTQLEGVRLGPVGAGAAFEIAFSFCCALCPQEYTITAASHDPDGIWHDWMEEAIAVTVTDTRYTAGVANLRATVQVEPK